MVGKVDKTIYRNNVWAHLGALVGPMLACCLLIVILSRTTAAPLGLPLIALGGVLVCHMLKWRGVAIASACLALVLAYNLFHQSSAIWSWSIISALCAASTFVVTVLCTEESSQTWEKLTKDIDDSKQTISHLSERVGAGHKLLQERNDALQRNEHMKTQLNQTEEKAALFEHTLKLAKEEQGKILQELQQAHEENRMLSDTIIQLQETSSNNNGIGNENFQTQIEIVNEELLETKRNLQDALEIARADYLKAGALTNELASVRQQLKDQLDKSTALQTRAEEQVAQAKEDLSVQLQRFNELSIAHQKMKDDQATDKECIGSLQQQLEKVKTEEPIVGNAADEREVRRLNGLYQQLRLQFTEKSDVLAETRRELFKTQEKLLALQRDLEESKMHDEAEANGVLRRLLAEAENELAAVEQEHAAEVSQLHSVIDTFMART